MSAPKNLKLKRPGYTVIERTAAEFAATFYEAARNTGMTSKHPNARSYAKANFELFIPKAIEILTDMLARDDVSIHIKDEISNALIERVNDQGAIQLVNLAENRAANFNLPPAWTADPGLPRPKPEIINMDDKASVEKVVNKFDGTKH